jgi:hypothetical protein
MNIAKAEFQVVDRPAFRAAYVRALASSTYPAADRAKLLERFDRGPTPEEPNVFHEALTEIICDAADTMAWGVET